MVDFTKFGSAKIRTALGGAALLVLGVVGGAGTVAATRPTVELAPAQAVPIASLAQRDGLVTIKGKVAEVYGDRFTVADASGKTMVDAGRDGAALTVGSAVAVQGRYRDGQLHASFLVKADGTVEAVRGGRPMRGPGGEHGGPGRHGGPDRDRRGPPMDDCAAAPTPDAAPAPAPAAK